MIIQYRTLSECGPRYKNEDYIGYVLMPEHQRAMFILCDGMGGHRSGDIASQTVVKSISNYWRGNPKYEDCDEKIIDACNVAKVALEKRPQVEMGTTMVMACIENGIALIAHCGDSRCYHFHTWGLQHWHTTDHRNTTPEGWEYVSKVSYRVMKLTSLKSMNMSLAPEIICSCVVMACIKVSVMMKKSNSCLNALLTLMNLRPYL